jgi:hypothetical protein
MNQKEACSLVVKGSKLQVVGLGDHNSSLSIFIFSLLFCFPTTGGERCTSHLPMGVIMVHKFFPYAPYINNEN